MIRRTRAAAPLLAVVAMALGGAIMATTACRRAGPKPASVGAGASSAAASTSVVRGNGSESRRAGAGSSASASGSTNATASAVATGATGHPATMPSTTNDASNALVGVTWRSLVAAEAWQPAIDAIDAIDAVDPAARVRPEVRVGRARAAVGVCTVPEGERALAELKEVAAETLPTAVREVVAALHSEALVCAARWREALDVAGASGIRGRSGAVAARLLARALEETGDVSAARGALDRAIAGGRAAGIPLGPLLVWRLRLDGRLGDTAEADADRRRLFLEHPRTFEALPAGGQGALPALDVDSWLRRADALAADGRADAALLAIDEAAKVGRAGTTETARFERRIARARGHALYAARAYARAASALEAASKLAHDEDAVDDAFHAARATSRAGDDEAAIAAYEALARAHPTSRWGAEAAYLAGFLRFLHGRWRDAVSAFDRYLASPSAKGASQRSNVREAKRARAMALLESGDTAGAMRVLHALATGPEYAGDAFARGRIELLAAIARERSGDRAGAIVRYEALSRTHARSYLELAARRRLAGLGVAARPAVVHAPVGEPPAPSSRPESPPPLPPPLPVSALFLRDAGLARDAAGILRADARPRKVDDLTRCAWFGEVDAAHDAYLLGVRVRDASEDPGAPRCGFPTPHGTIVAALEKRDRLPRGLLYAIIRQESGFRVDAVSSAGAIGIAQLMPETAVTTAAEIGVTLDPTDIAALQSPYLQLDLASRHLRAIFTDLVGDAATDAQRLEAVPLVAASYNAGVAAVRRWLRDVAADDAELFLERIPYVETRGYTARVVGNLARYAAILGGEPPRWPEVFAVMAR